MKTLFIVYAAFVLPVMWQCGLGPICINNLIALMIYV